MIGLRYADLSAPLSLHDIFDRETGVWRRITYEISLVGFSLDATAA